MSMRRTKIVCTLGPACSDSKVLDKMVAKGMNVGRINLAHGSLEEHSRQLALLRSAAKKAKAIVSTLVDLPGSKIRTGMMRGGKVFLREGAKIELTEGKVEGTEQRIQVNHPGFLSLVSKGSSVFFDDGMLEVKVVGKKADSIECEVVVGGDLGSRKGVSIPNVEIDAPAFRDKDMPLLEFAKKEQVDFIGMSFIRRASDVTDLRKLLVELECDAHIIAKIESPTALKNLKEIVAVADGVMVARGDLGVQLPSEDVPVAQKTITRECAAEAKPVIVATQMLDSMIRNPAPTRAEVTDVANAILDGADAVMLSGETAMGKYPVRAIEMMDKVIRKTEGTLFKYDLLANNGENTRLTIPQAISKSVVQIARDLRANAIITYTSKGHTARYIARHRPFTPIIAATANEREIAKLQLLWGVIPELIPKPKDTDDLIDKAVAAAEAENLVGKGDLVVITAGIPINEPGTTNLLKAHVV